MVYSRFAAELRFHRTITRSLCGAPGDSRALLAIPRVHGDLVRSRRFLCLCQQTIDIEGFGEDLQLPIWKTRPLFPGTIPTELNAILVGITQVKRFTHPMIGGAIELDTGADHAPEGIAQVGTSRIKNGNMIKTSRSRWWRGTLSAFPSIKTDVMMIAPGRNKSGFLAETGDEFEPKYPTVKS
jgi:hypothetical protein